MSRASGSVHVFFGFSTGLAKPVAVPQGTMAACREHVQSVTDTLKLTVAQYKNNAPHWSELSRFDASIPDDVLCSTVVEHNAWVRDFYDKLAKWSRRKPSGPTEKLTPEAAKSFWHGLSLLTVPLERWTQDYYLNRMAHAVRVMVTGEDEGVAWGSRRIGKQRAAVIVELFAKWMGTAAVRADPFPFNKTVTPRDTAYANEWTILNERSRYAYTDAMQAAYSAMRGETYPTPPDCAAIFAESPLTIRQAADVIWLFSEWLDEHDLRLDVPECHDSLASSYDGGYVWCSTHGAVDPDDRCRGRRCELGRETAENDREWGR